MPNIIPFNPSSEQLQDPDFSYWLQDPLHRTLEEGPGVVLDFTSVEEMIGTINRSPATLITVARRIADVDINAINRKRSLSFFPGAVSLGGLTRLLDRENISFDEANWAPDVTTEDVVTRFAVPRSYQLDTAREKQVSSVDIRAVGDRRYEELVLGSLVTVYNQRGRDLRTTTEVTIRNAKLRKLHRVFSV